MGIFDKIGKSIRKAFGFPSNADIQEETKKTNEIATKRIEEEKINKLLEQGYTLEQAKILLVKEKAESEKRIVLEAKIMKLLTGVSLSVCSQLASKIADQIIPLAKDDDFTEKLNYSTIYQAICALNNIVPPETNTVCLKFLLDAKYGEPLCEVLSQYKCAGLSTDPIYLIKQLKAIAYFHVDLKLVNELRTEDLWQDYSKMNATIAKITNM